MTARPGPWLTFLYCVAYDWRLAVRSIASVWDIADEIIVGWDDGGHTWGGDHFVPPEPIDFVDHLHLDGAAWPKLRIVRGDFYAPDRDRQRLQVQERVALSHLARPGGWIVTIDADEELVNPQAFKAWVRDNPPHPGMGLRCSMVSVYKVIGDQALVYDSAQPFPFAQAEPGCFVGAEYRSQTWLDSPAMVLHWHMGRTEEELRTKLRALSPVGDGDGLRDPEDMVAVWRETTLDNYAERARRGATCYADGVPLKVVPLSELRALAERGAL